MRRKRNWTDGSSAQAATPRSRFRLLDAMILVAAAATGFGVMLSTRCATKRNLDRCFSELICQKPWYDLLANSEKILVLSLLTMPLVAMVSLALIPIRLVGTRTRFRRVARQPGLVASCASGVAIAFIGLPVAIAAMAASASWDEVSRMLAVEEQIWSTTMYGGLAVLISWTTQFVGGRWRAERCWLDRLGRALGLYWIVAAIALWTALLLIDATSYPFRIRVNIPTLDASVCRAALQLATIIMPLVSMVNLALIPIRFFDCRPRLRRLVCQPGLMASIASSVAIILIGVQVVVLELVAVAFADDNLSWHHISALWASLLDEEMLTLVMKSGGFAVLVSWMTLLVGRKWRAETNWADRLGRAMGFCWITAAIAVAIAGVLIHRD